MLHRSVSALTLIALMLPAHGFSQRPQHCGRVLDLSQSVISEARLALWRATSVLALPVESGLFRSVSQDFSVCADSLPPLRAWRPRAAAQTLAIVPLEVSARSNSAYPRSTNDGAAWGGTGWTFGAAGGLRATWKFLTAQVAPEIFYQENRDFSFEPNRQPGRSEFANPYHADIDYPTRFGTQSFYTVDLGQSFVRVQAGPISLSAGTENLWIGAANSYPILISRTAPGFPHVRLGTQRPLRLPGVDLEVQLVFASLRESEYFDSDDQNDEHYFTVSVAVVKPRFVPGLSLGVARAYHDTATATGQDLRFYAERLIETPFGAFAGGNRIGNGIGVLLARWVLPESNFEIYGEWSREDTPGDWKDVLREPDWTQAYVLGFQKVFDGPRRLIRFYGELIHLGESAPSRAGRGFFSYYTHSTVRQGHTHRGQLLGAAIGPGSDATLLGLDVFAPWGRTGVRVERARYDEDTYYRTFSRRYGETRHDAEITIAGNHTHLLGPFEFDLGVSYSRRYGRYFLPLPNGEPDLVENNVGLQFRAGWFPP